jgi:arabinogalactan endo-1,4-beta-galactosidase
MVVALCHLSQQFNYSTNFFHLHIFKLAHFQILVLHLHIFKLAHFQIVFSHLHIFKSAHLQLSSYFVMYKLTAMKRAAIFTLCLHSILILFISFPAHAQTFAKGADIGWLSQMEASGRRFYNSSGVDQDCIQILKDKGINSIRLRVWVNPAAGYCNINDVVAQAVRAKAKGMRIMIDFHYSDSWADPGQQTKPALWVGQSFTTLLTSVYNHTYNSLNTLKLNGVIPEWVQVGNETNNGMLWEDGRASVSMSNFARLVASGYDAVKANDASSKVIVHISNGYDNSLFRWMFDGLSSNGGKWDVIGMSLYPTQSNWASLNTQCLANMNDMVTRYSKEVMLCEIGMDVGPAPTVKAFIGDLITKIKSVPNNKGLGIFYWEPQSYNKWQGYTKSAFDLTGKPTVAMDAFLENPPASPVTNYLLNPNFDADNTGTQTPQAWSESGATTSSYTSIGNGWNPEGNYYLNQYQATAFQARTFQTVSLPNGHYTLTAWAIRGSGHNACQMYATAYGGADLTANIAYNDAWVQVTIPDINVTNGQVTIGFFSDGNAGNWLNIDAVVLTNFVSLPVSLISYSASLQPNGHVKLDWKTASESNNKIYTIERSSDAINFLEIGRVLAKGINGSGADYTFTDAAPIKARTNYYRLKQIDKDNKVSILGVKLIVAGSSKTGLNINYDALNNSWLINHDNWIGKNVTIQLMSVDGKKVYSHQLIPSSINVSVEVPKLPVGQYVVQVVGDGVSGVGKVVVR